MLSGIKTSLKDFQFNQLIEKWYLPWDELLGKPDHFTECETINEVARANHENALSTVLRTNYLRKANDAD